MTKAEKIAKLIGDLETARHDAIVAGCTYDISLLASAMENAIDVNLATLKALLAQEEGR